MSAAPGRRRPYPAYKDSGVEWLGEIPAHWEVHQLRRVASIRVSTVDKKEDDGGLPVRCVGTKHVFNSPRIAEGIDFETVSVTPREMRAFQLHKGDVVITKDSVVPDNIAAASIVSEDLDDVVCGYHMAIVRSDDSQLASQFMFWQVTSEPLFHQFLSAAHGVTIIGLAPDEMGSVSLAIPPLDEQRAIAAFLDRETAKIDALVAKKERLIALLQEKRTALISHAVTKGLDPNAPMKDSGVEWLGEIPAHWTLRRLKTLADVRMSNVDKKTVEGQLPVALCNYTDVYYHEVIGPEIDFMQATATEEQARRFTLRAGDVLITKDSEIWTDIAVPAVVAEDLNGVICGYHLALASPFEGVVDGRFLARAFAAVGPRDQFQISAHGITRYGLSSDAIRTGVFAVPPIDEQRAIAAFLDRETARIDALVAKVREGIERLKEYRTALISAAVTGKIDVREEVDSSLPSAG